MPKTDKLSNYRTTWDASGGNSGPPRTRQRGADRASILEGNAMTLPDLKAEFRIFCDGDDWGETMCWLFTIADELHFERATPVPDEWQFRPSPLGPSNDDDDFRTDCVREADDETLVRFGNLLTRYARLLRKHGKDY